MTGHGETNRVWKEFGHFDTWPTIHSEHTKTRQFYDCRMCSQVIRVASLALSLAVSLAVGLHAQSSGATSQIPFVGCKSDGQVGPLASPKGKAKAIGISSGDADQLAYYKAENGFGILAPRGWYCFSTYGSNGSSLFVSPDPINDKELFTSDWKGFSGPAIQVSVAAGDTSGRFTVAKTIARVFPERMEFVRDVVSEGIEPASSFPTTPYATDTLQRLGKNIVEFETPASTRGLGTQSRLAINSSPIRGVVILFGEEPNLVQLSMRLPSRYQSLGRAIVRQLEMETADQNSDKE